ncbi:unnamed protein product, partial [Rotaria socialis]
SHDQDMYRIKLRAEVLAHLISMPIQLIHLRVEQFEWFIHLIKYVNIYLIIFLYIQFLDKIKCYSI